MECEENRDVSYGRDTLTLFFDDLFFDKELL